MLCKGLKGIIKLELGITAKNLEIILKQLSSLKKNLSAREARVIYGIA